MKRLTQEELAKIITLCDQGRSLRFISSELGLAKTTVYYHFRKKLGRRYVEMVFDHSPTLALGEFLGLFAADGCFYEDKKRYQYTLKISLSRYQLPYARIVQGMIERLIGKKPRIDLKPRMVELVVRGKQILGFLHCFLEWHGRRTHTIHFRESALHLGKDFLRGVVRGLIAGDGGVYPTYRRIAFGVVSRKLAEQFSSILVKFGIPSRLHSIPYEGKKTLHHVTVSGRTNLKKFKLRVGLTDPVKSEQLEFALRR